MTSNKFIMKIYSMTNLMILILYYKYSYFLYNFGQSLYWLTTRETRIIFFYGRNQSISTCLAFPKYSSTDHVDVKIADFFTNFNSPAILFHREQQAVEPKGIFYFLRKSFPDRWHRKEYCSSILGKACKHCRYH
jgi:hypothetical protein